jgi:hypothetical protein
VSQGNVLYRNRHDFAADPWARTGYNAYDNLVLGPLGAGHSVDMHGSGDPGHWQGGRAGDAFDVAYNTILQVRDDKPVLALRGTPCRFMKFRSNVVREDRVRAILDRNEVPGRTVISNNLFDADVSMTDLAVGNFDGDRNHDVFIGTGAGWFYSPAGRREWRFLSRNVERASELRFGDFDGDGRTDVVAKHGTSVDVSWAGESPWQRLTTTALGIEDLAVGDFNGDGIADLFASNGVDWLTAASGVGGWTYFATSGKRVRDLRFGDFDNDRRTDVLGVEGGMWKLVNAAGGEWTPWNSQLSEPMETMVIADFDSDSIPDVAGTVVGQWRFSKSGAGPWVTLRNSDVPMHRIPIGRFDDNVAFSALVYIQDYFDIFITGRGNGSRWSRQIMR